MIKKYFNPRSLAGATTISHFAFVYGHNFNPRSLAGATFLVSTVIPFIQISIHAPSRERREVITNHRMSIEISIHAPSRERPELLALANIGPYFNPRSLAGATSSPSAGTAMFSFQSTLPRGSDRKAAYPSADAGISIHAPSRERPITPALVQYSISYFNPRSLAGATASKQITSLFI